MSKIRPYQLLVMTGAIVATLAMAACSSSGSTSSGVEPGRSFVNVSAK